MRRSLVPSLLVVAAFVAVLALPSSAGAIICPLQRGALIVPCCPVPTGAPAGAAIETPCCFATPTCCAAGTTACCIPTPCCASTVCCTANACPSGTLTISSTPDPSIAGRKVVITGALSRSPMAGVQVVLWRKLAGQTTFHRYAHATTNRSGRYSITLRRGTVNANQEWYASAAGLRSTTLVQRVTALVALSAAADSVSAGRALMLRGRVTPSHAGEAVSIQVRRAASWVVIARAKLGRRSSYATSMRFHHPGRVQLRAELRGDARNQRSDSPTVTVTVRP